MPVLSITTTSGAKVRAQSANMHRSRLKPPNSRCSPRLLMPSSLTFPPVPVWAGTNPIQPGRELSPRPERSCITHRCHRCRRGQQTDAGNLGNGLARSVLPYPCQQPLLNERNLPVHLVRRSGASRCTAASGSTNTLCGDTFDVQL